MLPSLLIRARSTAQATVRVPLKPSRVQAPNGVPAPERLANFDMATDAWCDQESMGLPSPMKAFVRYKNGYVESFNGKLRDELLNQEIFLSMLEAR